MHWHAPGAGVALFPFFRVHVVNERVGDTQRRHGVKWFLTVWFVSVLASMMYRLQGFVEDHRRRHVGNQLEQPSFLLHEGGPPIGRGARQSEYVERQVGAHHVKKG